MNFIYSQELSNKVTNYLKETDFLTADQWNDLEKKSVDENQPLLTIFLNDFPDFSHKTAQLIAHLSDTSFLGEGEKVELLPLEGSLVSVKHVKVGRKPSLVCLDPDHEELKQVQAQKSFQKLPLYVASPDYFDRLERPKSQVQLTEGGQDAADANAFVFNMLKQCVEKGASDVHIDLGHDKEGSVGFKLRYRVDGKCRDEGFYGDVMLYRGIVNKLKLDAGLKIDERRLPQDGRISFELEGKVYNFRLSFMPNTVRNQQEEKIVLRQMADVETCNLYDLDIHPYALKDLEKVTQFPHGFVCVTGPTGSGKTTLLYALLQQIDRVQTNVMTLEDPIEAEIPLVNQSQAFHRIGYDFAAGLRVMLRQDPDVIMVGEMRDEETANKAFEAANTGHLVFSTLHTNTAASSITRLLQMQVPFYFISSALKTVIAQRLVRRICTDCRREHPYPKDMLKSIDEAFAGASRSVRDLLSEAKKSFTLYAESDSESECKRCHGLGYKGRMAVMEVMKIDDEIRHVINAEQGNEGEIQAIAEKNGMMTLQQYGYLQVLKGMTTFEEVNRVVMGV